MKKEKWFDRKFDFSFDQNILPSIIERLEKTPLLLKIKMDEIPTEHLTIKRNGKWSIQENIGHLIDLEPIWQGRLEDILNNKEELRAADLENKKTDLAGHNEKDIHDLIDEFMNIRFLTIKKLRELTDNEAYKSSLHPRLKTPMRTMDLFLFVAEHDDYHLARIIELETTYNTS
jgi:uncharacterized damage-inducible protein DinB